jgi:two-component system, OmpR family, sensor kinase
LLWSRPWTLRLRLVVAVLVVAALGLTAVGAASIVLLRQSLIARVDDQLTDLDQQWRGLLPRARRDPPPELARRGLPTEFRIVVLGPSGETLRVLGQDTGDLGGPELRAHPPQDLGRSAGEPFTVPDRAGESPWRVNVVPMRGGRSIALAQSLATVESTVQRLLRIELAVGAFVLVLLGVISAAVVRIGLRPLTRIEQTATAVAAAGLDQPAVQTWSPGPDSHTETGRLARAFDTMLGRLRAAFRQQEESEGRLRRFVADVSHELRTPLTSIRGFAELYRRGGAPRREDVEAMMGRIEAEATRMGMLVEDLLLLARLDQERPLDLAEVDLGALVRDAAADVRAHDAGRQVHLAVPDQPVRVLADEHRLRQVVGNLVTNAVHHTPARCPVRISARWTTPHDPHPTVASAAGVVPAASRPMALLEVADSGPGIPPDQAPQVFTRLYRGASHRQPSGRTAPGPAAPGPAGPGAATPGHNGSGLGLAIVAAIVAAHGGRIELVTGPGLGACFRVLLPAGTLHPNHDHEAESGYASRPPSRSRS